MPSTLAPRTPPTPMFCYCYEMLILPVTVGSLWSLTGQVSPVGLSLQFGGSPDLSFQPAGARLADYTQRPYCYKLATWTMALRNKTYKDSIFPTVLEMRLILCQTWEFKRSQVYGILASAWGPSASRGWASCGGEGSLTRDKWLVVLLCLFFTPPFLYFLELVSLVVAARLSGYAPWGGPSTYV